MQLARSFKTKQKYRAHELRLIVIIIIRISRSEASKRNFKDKEQNLKKNKIKLRL